MFLLDLVFERQSGQNEDSRSHWPNLSGLIG
jgi:hypothetical protein